MFGSPAFAEAPTKYPKDKKKDTKPPKFKKIFPHLKTKKVAQQRTTFTKPKIYLLEYNKVKTKGRTIMCKNCSNITPALCPSTRKSNVLNITAKIKLAKNGVHFFVAINPAIINTITPRYTRSDTQYPGIS